MKRSGRSAWVAVFVLGALGGASSAGAQQQAAADAAAPPTVQLERIEVTGSYIRRTDTETPSPVEVITAQDMKRSGYTSISDVLNNITANGQGTLSQGFGGAFAEGASGIALRGMTVGATLVLVDGHRLAPYPLADDGQRSFVDISSLPFDAVERIEVLKDGASAIYGSDAIAGVVNVILKKSFQGATMAAENGWSQRGGGATSHLTGTFGLGDLAADGVNAFVAIEYRHQDVITLPQRPYLNQLDYTAQGGTNNFVGANNNPTNPTPTSATGYFYPSNGVPGSAVNPFPYYGYLPGCTAAQQTNNQCIIPATWVDIEPQTQNLNLLARATKRLGEDWQASLTATFFQSEVANPGEPFNTTVYGYSNVGLAPGPNGLAIVTPYTTPGPFVAPVLPGYHLNPGNFPNGSPINVLTNDLGGQDNYVNNETYRIVADVRGGFAGWDVDATWGWTNVVMEVTQTGYPNFNNLYNDLADGQYVPGIQNSPSEIAHVAPAMYQQFSDMLWFTGAHASRDLWKLPGGPLSFATGVDFYFRSLMDVPNNTSVTAQQSPNYSYAEGSQSDWSVYGELVAPVIKSLELDGALRYDHYNSGLDATTPKFGFKFTPQPEVALRGTVARGFRAPNPVEAVSSGSYGYYNVFNDPVLCPHGLTASGSPNIPGNYPLQCSIAQSYLTNANPALQPEKSKSYTLGLILEPVKWASLSVDWYDIILDNQIYPSSEDPAVLNSEPIVRGAPLAQPYINAAGNTVFQKPSVGNYLYQLAPYININSTQVKGLEYNLKNRFNLGEAGKLTSDFMVSHTLHYYFNQPGISASSVDLAGTHGPNEISGDTGNPRNRAKWALSWDQGPVEVTLTMNYISGYNVLDPSAISSGFPSGQNTCADALNAAYEFQGTFFPANVPNQYCQVASFTDFDLYTGWQIDKNWYVHAAIDNLFDREAPLDLQTYAAPNFNPSLHTAGAVGRFFLVGLSYKF